MYKTPQDYTFQMRKLCSGGYYTSVKTLAVLRETHFLAPIQGDINKTHFIQGARILSSMFHFQKAFHSKIKEKTAVLQHGA